ncbi:EXOC1 [Cordylochernes scorpioides]|uniref:EXOC1 n=1 Tax=Cordylochernes scorpioides TaxID=51811 RepID=A0ABY6KPZ8_9ARAC|nr:EXOC1 [Cordylochernes scorpioides]
MENFHHVFTLLYQLKIGCLETERKEAKQKYSEALQAYVTHYFGRPLEKLNFPPGCGAAVLRGSAAEGGSGGEGGRDLLPAGLQQAGAAQGDPRVSQQGDFDINDKEHGKPSKKFEDEELQALLDKDDAHTQELLATSLNVTRQAVSLR